MNILIIDDDYIKKEMIRRTILSLYPDANIRWFTNYQDSIMFIDDNHDFIDYIILDWCFPPTSTSRAKYGMGRQILSYMNMQEYHNDVIICSSDIVSVNKNDYSNVKASIEYEETPMLKTYLFNAINGNSELEKEDIKVRFLKPKKDNNTGYKRRLSSTPWWMK